MFKKGPDIDKKKLLLKASDVKKDSLSRLKHFRTLIEHSDYNELPGLFKSHFSFIYHTFIDTFSTFDCNSKQRREDLDCILFMLEKILIFNPELIKKRWQFYSITFVMQKLLHANNSWRLRQEGVRLFILWYLILCDEASVELQSMFGSLVPNLLPPSAITLTTSNPTSSTSECQHPFVSPKPTNNNNSPLQVPIKLCSIDALVPAQANEQLPNDETSFYLDSLLQFMVTQTTKPCWSSSDDARMNQELGFSFTYNMFKKLYLPYIFPDLNLGSFPMTSPHTSSSAVGPKPIFTNHSIQKSADDSSDDSARQYQMGPSRNPQTAEPVMAAPRTSIVSSRPLQINLRHQTGLLNTAQSPGPRGNEPSYQSALSMYQAIVIRWLTRIMRQDMIPGQDELIKSGGGSAERSMMARDLSSNQLPELSQASEANSGAIFNNMESTSREMDIARRVAGTWPDNITVMHDLFRRAFLTYHQPASMKRVVNVYKEWICNGGPNQQSTRNPRLGYTSFSDLLQIFVLNSSNAFVTRVHNPSMLEEQVEMCKRIMNIYRYMVMKIYMNTATWEQLLNVMLSITERLFPIDPPEKKESTIGGRIAPAFFQTFIVSWIRANLYVHISGPMWDEFHRVMKSLIAWRELVEEWSSTMGSLTRVLVKHVYGLNLAELPLDKPQDRRRRPRAMKSFSTAESTNPTSKNSPTVISGKSAQSAEPNSQNPRINPPRSTRPTSVRFETCGSKESYNRFTMLTRSCSDGFIDQNRSKLYSSSLVRGKDIVSGNRLRRIKSEQSMFESDHISEYGRRSSSPSHTDVMDANSLKDSNMIIEHDQAALVGDGHLSTSEKPIEPKSNRKPESSASGDGKCVLLGGTVRGWTNENSVIMWRRMLGLFGNINHIEDPDTHLVAIRCLAVILCDFIKTRENLGISLDNQCTPAKPDFIPPYTYYVAWLLEATNLPRQYRESRLTAYKLLCLMSIRRHDIEMPQTYYASFYTALYRGLASSDPSIHSSIIKNATQLLSLELPGCTFLADYLFERSRTILLSNIKEMPLAATPRDQAIQVLGSLLSLHRPIKKLMVLRSEAMNQIYLSASGDIKCKIMDSLLQCNVKPISLDSKTRARSLGVMAMHVYQELTDKSDSPDIERLIDTLLTELQNFDNNNIFRISCDLLRLFSDHASSLCQMKPALVSSVVQTICQMIVRMSVKPEHKESIHCLLICLDDWCLAVGQHHLLRPFGQLSADEDADDTLLGSLDETLITIILRSLESVIHDEQYLDDLNSRGTRGSINTSKGSDGHSSSNGRRSGFADQSPASGSSQRDRTMTNDSQLNSSNLSNREESIESKNLSAIKLACKVSHLKLSTYVGHFPLRQVGAASLSCCVNELDYIADERELTDNKSSSGVILLVINETTIVSLVGSSLDATAQGADKIHLIVRNLCGKYSWDATYLDLENPHHIQEQGSADSISLDPDAFQNGDASRVSMRYDSDFNDDGNSSSSMLSRSSASQDCISDLLNQLNNLTTHASLDSSSQSSYKKRNTALSVSNPRYKMAPAEETMIALLVNQRFQELNYCEEIDETDRVVLKLGGTKQPAGFPTDFRAGDAKAQGLSFERCRRLVQHLGLLSWEKRCKVDTLAKNARLLRELKNLDAQPGRETHKIAVIYIANGQEDKNSILSNTSGSRAFEEFVSGLGWEVNLTSHLGFKGGLQSNKSTGDTSPYYCNATTEVMYHVSTRIPLNGPADDESLNRKLRHLGNDEVQIVWSEHTRDYRRGIIPTEFGDVIIAIYPMLTFQGYYRIQIMCKPDVPLFGPLFDNCIVHQTSLAQLVRATAINASRAKRLNLPYYQSHFEERHRLIETIIQNYTEKQSYEDFAAQLYKTPNMIPKPQPTAKSVTPE